MTESVLSNISSILKCNVCLEVFRDPRMLLPCLHVFCKQCIESLMKFQSDGSALIQCPNQCPQPYRIEPHQTADDLGMARKVKEIIAMLPREEVKTEAGLGAQVALPFCEYRQHDKSQESSVYCCGTKMCEGCYGGHLTDSSQIDRPCNHESSLGYTIKLDSETESGLTVWCKKHLSRCTHVCTDLSHDEKDVVFVCLYCRYRDHKEHPTNTIDESVLELKQTLQNNASSIEKLSKIQLATQQCVAQCTARVEKTLRQRKLECIGAYIDEVCNEEERIRQELSRAFKQHLKGYLYVDANWKKFRKEELCKYGISLLLDKHNILQFVQQQDEIPNVDISLDRSSPSKTHPLGNLVVTKQEMSVKLGDLPDHQKNMSIASETTESPTVELLLKLIQRWRDESLRKDEKTKKTKNIDSIINSISSGKREESTNRDDINNNIISPFRNKKIKHDKSFITNNDDSSKENQSITNAFTTNPVNGDADYQSNLENFPGIVVSHIPGISPVKSSTCQICQKQMSSKSAVRRHIKEVHKVELKTKSLDTANLNHPSFKLQKSLETGNAKQPTVELPQLQVSTLPVCDNPEPATHGETAHKNSSLSSDILPEMNKKKVGRPKKEQKLESQEQDENKNPSVNNKVKDLSLQCWFDKSKPSILEKKVSKSPKKRKKKSDVPATSVGHDISNAANAVESHADITSNVSQRVLRVLVNESSQPPFLDPIVEEAGVDDVDVTAEEVPEAPKEKKKKVDKVEKAVQICCRCNEVGDGTSIVKCDECAQWYHFLTCISPPYTRNPKRTKYWGWFCEMCETAKRQAVADAEMDYSVGPKAKSRRASIAAKKLFGEVKESEKEAEDEE